MASNNQKHQREEKESPTSESSTSPDSNKRLKTLTLTLISSPNSSNSSSSSSREKGKEKIDEEEEVDSTTCGICLSDEGKAIQGRIDSCDHFFCFVCIMEWAKLESRCPMCKRRFKSIRRPPKDGVFACERTVEVPARDQVYHPLGNGTTGPSDPYAHVYCTECQSSKDESLLLLCDLCDSASHTYCVGLGYTVPEGDWYCHDCNVSRNEHSNSQLDTDCSYKSLPRSIGTMPTYETDVSISEIVQEETTLGELAMRRSINYVMYGNQVEHDRPPRRGHSQSSLPAEQSSSTSISVREPEQGARTLHQCRNLYGRIQALRENWNALRNGSVSFSSGFLDSRDISNVRRRNSKAGICDNSSKPQPLISTTRGEDNVSTSVLNRSSCDVERAWKMMKIAKSMKGATGDARSDNPHIPNHQTSKRNVLTEAINKNSSSLMLNGKSLTHKVNGRITLEKCQRHHPIELEQKKCKSRKCEKQPMIGMEDMQQVDIRFPASHLSSDYELQSSKQVMKSFQESVSHMVMREPSDLDNQQNALLSCALITDSLPRVSDLSSSRTKPVVSSSCKVDHSRNIVGGYRKSKGRQRKDDGAKSEVQSLVKLNLKLLSNNKQLGVDRFKEVAKLATHTILAACGLEHSKSSVRPFPSLICTHVMQSQQFRASNLMPSSCRECFYGFVKDVVNSIMDETNLNASS